MGFSSWLYTDSKKNLRVKIVHPGGHAELHERPLLASEIIRRNPRCCVAHPNVFKQPWAIVQPDTMLMPGQKFYIVPISTIRKLQNSLKHPSSHTEQVQTSQSSKHEGEDGLESPCWLIANTPKLPHSCLKSSTKSSGCFTRRVKGATVNDNNKDSSEDTKGSSSWGSSETVSLAKKRGAKDENKLGESPKRLASLDYWQPDLQSVNEE